MWTCSKGVSLQSMLWFETSQCVNKFLPEKYIFGVVLEIEAIQWERDERDLKNGTDPEDVAGQRLTSDEDLVS